MSIFMVLCKKYDNYGNVLVSYPLNKRGESSMHIVVVHGYFLKGTGSNLFVYNICAELCRMGHRVTLFCQESAVAQIDFIEAAFDLDENNKTMHVVHSKDTPYPGKCTLIRPNTNGFLPVYVYDRYQGYFVKEFHTCSEDEIETYLNHHVSAIDTALNNIPVDLVLSNHTIMQPVYVARSTLGKSGAQHVAIVHGSCLNFAVKRSSLLQQYAWLTIENADRIAFVSKYSKVEFIEFFENHPLVEEKSIIIPAGVDLNKFVPLREGQNKESELDNLLQSLSTVTADTQEDYSWKTDSDIDEKLRRLDLKKTMIYYGKYLWTKGVQLLIAAAPIILQKHPDVRFVLVGFGSSRAYFEALIEALDHEDREKYIALLQHPQQFDSKISPNISRFFVGLIQKLKEPEYAEQYFSMASNYIKASVTFTGYLDHDQLKHLIACSDISVAPSIFPEAFGLVAVEALSAGIIPIQTNHSGFSDVIKKYVDEFSDIFDKRRLVPLYLDENLVLNLANNACTLLQYYENMSDHERQLIRQRARKVASENYSWNSVVRQYITLYK